MAQIFLKLNTPGFFLVQRQACSIFFKNWTTLQYLTELKLTFMLMRQVIVSFEKYSILLFSKCFRISSWDFTHKGKQKNQTRKMMICHDSSRWQKLLMVCWTDISCAGLSPSALIGCDATVLFLPGFGALQPWSLVDVLHWYSGPVSDPHHCSHSLSHHTSP